MQLNQANVGKQISKYLAEGEAPEFGGPPLEIPNPDGVKKRKRNTSIQEQSEKYYLSYSHKTDVGRDLPDQKVLLNIQIHLHVNY